MLEFSNEWGGVVGILGGALGGAFAIYRSIRNTAGPKERAFMGKAALWIWLVMLGLAIGLGYALGPSYSLWIIGLMLLVLVIGIPICSRRQTQIRAEESQESLGK